MKPKKQPVSRSKSKSVGGGAAARHEEILRLLRERFEEHRDRHPGIEWKQVEARLTANPDKLRSLVEMERTGGEPDVVDRDERTGGFRFVDCSEESPAGRRSLCYDGAAREARKEHRPEGSALEMAESIGIEILSESEYRRLQQLGEFDRKTSSWVKTPPQIRAAGGALFCDRRYDAVFVYHNGAQSYYGSRGFRGSLVV